MTEARAWQVLPSVRMKTTVKAGTLRVLPRAWVLPQRQVGRSHERSPNLLQYPLQCLGALLREWHEQAHANALVHLDFLQMPNGGPWHHTASPSRNADIC